MTGRGGEFIFPTSRSVGPDGPRYVYTVDGARVVFDRPITRADLDAAREVARAGRRALMEMIAQAVDAAGDDFDPRDLEEAGGGGIK